MFNVCHNHEKYGLITNALLPFLPKLYVCYVDICLQKTAVTKNITTTFTLFAFYLLDIKTVFV